MEFIFGNISLSLFTAFLVAFIGIYQVGSTPLITGNNNSWKIVGGGDAIPHELPWQVSLRQNLNTLHLCGGVILDTYTVLTTARCAELLDTFYSSVAAGKHNLSATEASQQILIISSIHVHPQFPGSTDYSNDIAVIKVSQPFQWTEFVTPIESLHDEYPISTEIATISGWGTKREEEIALQENLQKATVKIMDNLDCQQIVGHEIIVEESMVCIAAFNSDEPVDSCTGDQGGPLIVEENGLAVLVGLISFGTGCGRPNVPSFCTRVFNYLDFIHSYMETQPAK
ncbi:unnamed protein product [Orchesella dallaii]|uniref:Peptidase S1 domain-containing protein n=1 Tax=Orchesella dallaii TaxID=48710 RepID=A0ABP1QPF8_9HEXA